MNTLLDCSWCNYVPFARKKIANICKCVLSFACSNTHTTCLSCIFLLFEVFDCSNVSAKQSAGFLFVQALNGYSRRFCWFSPFSSLKTTLTPFDTYSHTHTHVCRKSRKTTITYALFTSSYISFVFVDMAIIIIMWAVISMPAKTFL